MASSFLFYDLETSGINPRHDRIMQFAAQRTDMNLKPIGSPYNYIIQMSPDVLPSPEAILVTGITPQKTQEEGIREVDFLRIFTEEIVTPDTIFVGFNSIRFDDEFMRFLHYRNFYDPYEWSWKDGRSRWDVLDLVRMTRALRPDGIQWPFASDGAPTNRLELLTEVNGIQHDNAHDAMSDVNATLAVAQLIAQRQPKLFDYLLKMRDKKAVAAVVESMKPFVYSSGKYPSEYHKTTVAQFVGPVSEQSGAAIVFDLRANPEDFLSHNVDAIASAWKQRQNERSIEIPIKVIKYNRCPAIAPFQVLDKGSAERIQIDLEHIAKHGKLLAEKRADIHAHAEAAMALLQEQRQEALFADEEDVDAQLYDGFFGRKDASLMQKVRASPAEQLHENAFTFEDTRLRALLPLYKARNFPDTLTDDEAQQWEAHRKRVLTQGGDKSRLNSFAKSLYSVSQRADVMKDPAKQYLLQELQLYAESIAPVDI